MIVYKLDSPINTQKLLQDIQNLINKFPATEGETPLLVVSIKTISYDNDTMIPKLEYKPE